MKNRKAQFNPDFRDLPHAFFTTTKKGKHVYRMRLNEDEILTQLEQGNTQISIDIPCDANGVIKTRTGRTGAKAWKSFGFYGWAVPKKQEEAKVEES